VSRLALRKGNQGNSARPAGNIVGNHVRDRFLASDAASFIIGIDIPVNVGSTAKRRSHGLIER
jgi:hypothetical protein